MATAPRHGFHSHTRRLRPHAGRQPEPSRRPVNRWLLWFGVLGGPVGFAAVRFAGAVLLAGPCAHSAGTAMILGLSPSQQVMAVITVVAALIAGAAGLVSWHLWSRTERPQEEQTTGTMRPTPFWALGGFFLSALFFILIILSGGLALGLGTSCVS